MPSSYTERNRYTLQATGEGANIWGAILNEGAFDLIDASMDGVTTISTTPVTLSTANGAEDQARQRVINYTGSSPGTITIPSVEKWYIVRAATQNCTITNGSASLTVSAGGVEVVITDASSIWRLRDAAMATKAYVNQTAFDANTGILPGQGSGIVGFLQTNNGATAWVELTVSMIDGLQEALDAITTTENTWTENQTFEKDVAVDGDLGVAGESTFDGPVLLDTAGPTDPRQAGHALFRILNLSSARDVALTDAECILRRNISGSVALTIQPNASVNLPVGFTFLVRVALGTVVLTRGSGVTLRSAGTSGSANFTLNQYAYVTVTQEDVDAWIVSGAGV